MECLPFYIAPISADCKTVDESLEDKMCTCPMNVSEKRRGVLRKLLNLFRVSI
jgi:hypothetical protein